MKRTLIIAMSFVALEGSQDPSLLIVNKRVSLGTYKPRDITLFQGVRVSRRIIADLKALLAAAEKDGLKLKVISGYRSYEYQKNLFERYVAKEQKKDSKLTRTQAIAKANTYSAQAGHSEHQLGTAVDILSAENNYQFTQDSQYKFVSWLENNAQKFHFKISFPKGHPEYTYEPWHVRWYPQ